jgi:hypothetical protein
MALTNAQRQARWRDRRNEAATALTGKPNQIADNILLELGAKDATKVVRALDKRLRNIKPDCPRCSGAGFITSEARMPCGTPLRWNMTAPCDCLPPAPYKLQWAAALVDGEWVKHFGFRDTEAEAEAIAEDMRRHYAGLKRKPRGVVRVISSDDLI